MTTVSAPITPITPAQKQVAEHLISGLTTSEIAAQGHLLRTSVTAHIRALRRSLHCPPRSSHPVLVHALLLHRQIPAPSLAALRPSFAADEDQQRLMKALAEHSATADVARAAHIDPADVKHLTGDLVRAAGAANATQLVGWGHALGLLGTSRQGVPNPSANRKGAAR
ncbi:DNA-binding protein [Streptomyces sp. NPDC058305]|uniref:DNA-binding protein n=1 Tax=Streptomyces sp. NPDC058305 TaxID=3346438 RepID=UPI0036EDF357